MEKLAFMGILTAFDDIYGKNLNKMSLKSSKHRFDYSKNVVIICFYLSFLSIISLSFSSCKTAYGCKTTEQYKVKTDKHGSLSMKRGKTKLFDSKHDQKKKKKKKG